MPGTPPAPCTHHKRGLWGALSVTFTRLPLTSLGFSVTWVAQHLLRSIGWNSHSSVTTPLRLAELCSVPRRIQASTPLPTLYFWPAVPLLLPVLLSMVPGSCWFSLSPFCTPAPRSYLTKHEESLSQASRTCPDTPKGTEPTRWFVLSSCLCPPRSLQVLLPPCSHLSPPTAPYLSALTVS
jgi:hypothetical protein